MSEINVYGDITPNTAGGMAAVMLNVAAAQAVTQRFAQVNTLPKNKGKTMPFRRYSALPVADTPLAEGVTPSGQRVTCTDLEVTMEQYGDLVWLTDVITDMHTDPVAEIESKRCGKQIIDTIETVNISVLKGGTNVVYAGNQSARASVNSAASRSDIRLIVRALRKQSAETIGEIIGATAKVGTEPVGEAYFAMGHTDLEADLRDISGFTPVEKYSSAEKAIKYEVGKVESVRFVLTPNFSPWAAAGTAGTTFLANGAKPSTSTSADVYPVIIVGKESYGVVPLQGKNAVTPMVKNPAPAIGDELGQKGFVSWKKPHACLILNQLWMCRYEVACRATPN